VPTSTPYRTDLRPLSDPLAREAWGSLLAESPLRSPYAHLAFADAVESIHRWPGRIAGVWVGDRLRAACVIHEKRRGPYRAAALPPLARFSAVLLDAAPDPSEVHAGSSPLDALLALLAARYHQVSLSLPPALRDVRPLQWAGWRLTPAFTYRAAVASGGDVTAPWSAGPRRTARASRDAFTIRSEAADVPAIISLVVGSHERQEKGLGLPGEDARAIAASLVDARLATPFLALRGDTPEAGILALTAHGEAHYWLAGSVPGPAMTVLLAGLFERLQADGIARLDFAGANTPSIAEFKRRFGAELVSHVRARLVTRPELRLLDAALNRF
jgi:hypothetical protein